MKYTDDELADALDPGYRSRAPSNIVKAADYFEYAIQQMVAAKPGIPISRFHFFSAVIQGLRENEFTIFCGSTGIGKTSFLANLSLSLMEQQIPQLVFSIENGPIDYLRRIMSAVLGSDIESGPMCLDRVTRFQDKFLPLIKDGGLHLGLYEDRIHVDLLMQEISEQVETNQVKVIIVDNINFMLEPTTAAEAMLEMDRVIHKLIMFCKRLSVHIIMVMHPRKTTTNRVESEFDIKGSSTAVQEAHNVWLFNRPDKDDVDGGVLSEFDRELTIAKSRRVGTATNQKFIFSTEGGVKYAEKRVIT